MSIVELKQAPKQSKFNWKMWITVETLIAAVGFILAQYFELGISLRSWIWVFLNIPFLPILWQLAQGKSSRAEAEAKGMLGAIIVVCVTFCSVMSVVVDLTPDDHNYPAHRIALQRDCDRSENLSDHHEWIPPFREFCRQQMGLDLANDGTHEGEYLLDWSSKLDDGPLKDAWNTYLAKHLEVKLTPFPTQ